MRSGIRTGTTHRVKAIYQISNGAVCSGIIFDLAAKTLTAFSAVLIVLTISLTTATMTPLSEGFEAGGKTSYAAANVMLGTGSTRTIAVVIPNSGTINSDWRTYRVSVDQVEAITGYDFFSNVPSAIQNVIEGVVDNQ